MIYALKYERPAHPGEVDEHGTPAVAVGFTTQPFTYDDLVRLLPAWTEAGPIHLGCPRSDITWWVVSWTPEEFIAFYGHDTLPAIQAAYTPTSPP